MSDSLFLQPTPHLPPLFFSNPQSSPNENRKGKLKTNTPISADDGNPLSLVLLCTIFFFSSSSSSSSSSLYPYIFYFFVYPFFFALKLIPGTRRSPTGRSGDSSCAHRPRQWPQWPQWRVPPAPAAGRPPSEAAAPGGR